MAAYNSHCKEKKRKSGEKRREKRKFFIKPLTNVLILSPTLSLPVFLIGQELSRQFKIKTCLPQMESMLKRNGNNKFSTFPQLALDINRSAVGVDDPFGNGKAKTMPPLLP